MKLFRKRPVVVQAVQLVPDNEAELSQLKDVKVFSFGSDVPGLISGLASRILYADIKTLEGTMRANPGDWIIRGLAGELYPCRADIFNASYEAVTETVRTV